jgi:hypothetical protein
MSATRERSAAPNRSSRVLRGGVEIIHSVAACAHPASPEPDVHRDAFLLAVARIAARPLAQEGDMRGAIEEGATAPTTNAVAATASKRCVDEPDATRVPHTT